MMKIGNLEIGYNFPPVIIADTCINGKRDFSKYEKMVYDCYSAGCKIVKFQHHIISEEMIEKEAKNIFPVNANGKSIWDVIREASLTIEKLERLKRITEALGMEFLVTPFSLRAIDELEQIGVKFYKIGSGECYNIPFVKKIYIRLFY